MNPTWNLQQRATHSSALSQREGRDRSRRWALLACGVALAAFIGLGSDSYADGGQHPRHRGRQSGGHSVHRGGRAHSSGKFSRSGQHHRGGRSHSVRNYRGGRHSYYSRHPRHGGRSYYGGRYRYGRHYRHGGHRHSRHSSFGLHFGYYGYPYSAYGYYDWWPYAYGPAYGPAYAPVAVVVPDTSTLDLEIKPEEAEVWVDGDLVGIADDFDGYPDVLALPPGEHTIVIRLEGYKDLTLRYDLRAGEDLRVRRRMVRQGSTAP